MTKIVDKLFFNVFKLSKLCFRNIAELTPNGANNALLGDLICTDGFSVNFLFYKRKTNQDELAVKINQIDLKLEDFDLAEINNEYRPVSLDPGRKSVFTAALDLDCSSHLRCTTSEYYHIRGSTKSSKDQNSKKEAAKREGKEKEEQKQEEKGRGEEVLESSKDEEEKPAPFQESKKISLIVFGAGMFGKDLVKLKGLRCGAVGKLFQTLKRREAKGKLIVTTINEFKTSKTCTLCFSDDLSIIKVNNFKGVGVVCCKKCPKVWQRDINAANNMMAIATSICLKN
ncbi:hypothetical protein [Parasitella parasitica]|uniref:Cas12f1-like TNB domain-containing protein n=1 Tax=Parasitella parasitica TaxID=35722 RepID=A0A0B7N4Q6_9FUNG|nr:hypothetical protein [Parasitella parasitica]